MQLTAAFRKLIFAQVLLGMFAYCAGTFDPMSLFVAVGVAVIAWLLVEQTGGRPLPQWAIAIGALGVVAWLLLNMSVERTAMIRAIGLFTMWLQLLLLFARKTNREYAELLILSLMTVICGAVLTRTFEFAMLLIAYLLMGAFTVLVFAIKVGRDRVRQAERLERPPWLGFPEGAGLDITGRAAFWRPLRRSGLVLVSLAAGLAVPIFAVLPREGQVNFNPLQGRRVGFATQIDLTGSPITNEDRSPVLTMRLTQAGEPARVPGGVLLRGASLDRYNAHSHSWERGPVDPTSDMQLLLPERGVTLIDLPPAAPVMEAQIAMQPAENNILFTLYPSSWIASDAIDSVIFNPDDHRISSPRRISGTVEYQLRAPASAVMTTLAGGLGLDTPEQAQRVNYAGNMSSLRSSDYARRWRIQADEVLEYAQTILEEAGIERPTDRPSTIVEDRRAMQALVEHFRTHYEYELNAFNAVRGQDPVIDFLFIYRRGHCEFFASGLAALARSLDIRTRVVSGYRAGEYNEIGGYYIVRRSDAHAWVEALLGESYWQPFDPTPPEIIEAQTSPRYNWIDRFTHLYNYFEFSWFSGLMSYDSVSRTELLDSLRSLLAPLREAFENPAEAFSRLYHRVEEHLAIVGPLVLGLGVLTVGLIAWLIRRLFQRWRLRRRIQALSLHHLDPQRRQQLARDLRFFIEMETLLHQRGLDRPAWQSPLDWARSLGIDHPSLAEPVDGLARLFYEIRFGAAPYDASRQAAARDMLDALKASRV